ncbi:MAG TPA: DNA repair protein RecN [Firmicutes bacterium]|nr:MAG: hypothetical protein AA931_01880 [Peptococcaceae bacterium 1109]HHT72738.1 DNA repair protein RecN [Bacillota bacterium]
MLREIAIHNFALVEELELSFYSGFSVLTGETGAGKSIIIDALGLLLGKRASTEMIRTGAESCTVQGVFAVHDEEASELLKEWGIPADDEVVISREVSANGRNRCRINGKLVSVSQLAQLGPCLAEIVGQHDSQSLLDPNRHLEFLDAFGGEDHQMDLDKLSEAYQKWTAIHGELAHLAGDERERNRRMDLLRFQVEEIAAAQLTPGEEEELVAERKRLANLNRLREAVEAAHSLLSEPLGQGDSLVRQLNVAQAELSRASSFDDELTPLAAMLAEAVAQVEELGRELWVYLDKLEADPQRLDDVESRLDTIDNLKRKYGDTVEEILRFAQKAQEELEFLEASTERGQELEKQLGAAWKAWLTQAQVVRKGRQCIARELEAQVEAQLRDLNMTNTRFVAAFEGTGAESRQRPVREGLERVQFLIAPNVGEDLKPLARIASGGELSRLMLAIKVSLAQVDAVPTIVFDEIDTGIGGQTAGRLGEKLRELGASRQVLCVTHLPVIASFGAHHYAVAKAASQGRTTVSAHELTGEERVRELTRMLGGAGEVNTATYAHARELLARGCGI